MTYLQSCSDLTFHIHVGHVLAQEISAAACFWGVILFCKYWILLNANFKERFWGLVQENEHRSCFCSRDILDVLKGKK